jgi:hypothetical protein
MVDETRSKVGQQSVFLALGAWIAPKGRFFFIVIGATDA